MPRVRIWKKSIALNPQWAFYSSPLKDCQACYILSFFRPANRKIKFIAGCKKLCSELTQNLLKNYIHKRLAVMVIDNNAITLQQSTPFMNTQFKNFINSNILNSQKT